MRISLRNVLFVCVALVGSAYGITLLRGTLGAAGFHSMVGSDEKRRQIEQLERENEILAREIEAKKAHLNNLQQNPDLLKLEIEDRLKLVSPGTKNFILQEGTPSREETPPATEPRP